MTGARQYVGKSIYTMMPDFKPQPYYARRLYGKYTIYNKDGAVVAKGLNQKEMENYMKLLKEEN
jgi:hypothetical protein